MSLQAIIGVQVLLTLTIGSIENFEETDSKKDRCCTMHAIETYEDDLTSLLQRYADYNHWANEQFAEWFRSASEDEMNREIESSYSSLKETIFHIWNAEYLWLQTLKDEDADNSPARNFKGTKDELLEGWLLASENFSNQVKTMSLADLKSERPNSGGDSYTVADMIQHCMNHSTYHRGQLITMGRQAGLKDPPRTDFIYYVSLMSK